ncbi:MAG: response regulator [Anaerolineales bacterium]|nr:response regulator [Anaerolineales bacterium]
MPEPVIATIRVLIVDDIAETRENIKKLLQFEADIEVVGGARSGAEGIQLATETRPHIVLMDINMPDMDGITATEGVIEQVPFCHVVILSVQSEPDYMRRAMMAGAKDFIPKPPSGDELIKTIRFLGERAKKDEERARVAFTSPSVPVPGRHGGTGRLQGKILSVYSAKGGVGCTTLATNLAVGLHTGETPVVMVDTNLQFGDVSVFLNLQVKNSIVDLASRAEELDRDYVEEILIAHQTGMRVLAAPPRPEMADEVHADQVRRLLQFLKSHYAYVVVDTHSTMDDVTLAVLESSDLILAVATPDIPAIKDSRLLFDLLGVLEIPKDRVFFVMNKMDRRTGITPEAVAENLRRPVDGEIPADERAFTSSINKGVPLMLGDKSRPPAKNLLDLVGLVKQRLVAGPTPVEEKAPERARLFSR